MTKPLLASLLISVSALAADPVSVKLPLNDVVDLSAAITALDLGQTKIIKPDGKPEQPTQIPYDLGPIRLTLARNLLAIQPDVDAFEKAKKAIIKEIWGAKQPSEADVEEQKKWRAKIDPMIATVLTVKLTKISVADLKLETNPIPIAVLKALAPILEP